MSAPRNALSFLATALILLACNQLAGIKKPDDTSSAGSGTDTSSDDSTSGDDTSTKDSGKGFSGTPDDPVSGLCNGGNGCSADQTCRSIDDSWYCGPVGSGYAGSSCQTPSECTRAHDCYNFVCYEYCSKQYSACDEARTCIIDPDSGVGACLFNCPGGDQSYCSTGETCVNNFCVPPTTPTAGGGR